MIWNSMRFVFVLLILCGLVACAGFGTQAEPTPAPVPSSTSTPLLTNTPEPTDTPLPTDTPTPTPTLTITPTPTPKIGDIRINPETGQEEVFSDPGDWVEVVKAAEVVDLKTATEENSEFTTNPDRSITLSWTPDTENTYEYTYPAAPENLVDPSGNPIEAELKTIFDDRRPFPVMRMTSTDDFPENFVNFSEDPFTQENEVGFFNYETEQWTPIFSVAEGSSGQPMDNLGTEKRQNWMPEVGLIKVSVSPQDASEFSAYGLSGEITHNTITLTIKPQRIINQVMIYQERVGNEVSWMQGLDENNNTISYPTWVEGDLNTSGVYIDDENTQPSFAFSYLRDPNQLPPLDMTREELFDYYEKSPVVGLSTIIDDPKLVGVFNDNINFNFTPDQSSGWEPGHLRHRISEIIQRNPEIRPSQEKWRDQLRNEGRADTDVTVGYHYVVIFEPTPN